MTFYANTICIEQRLISRIASFEKVHHVTHEFMLSCIGVSKNPAPELLNRVMNRDNVALSIILEAKDPSELFVGRLRDRVCDDVITRQR